MSKQKTFTDEDGNRYESIRFSITKKNATEFDNRASLYALRPLPPEPEQPKRWRPLSPGSIYFYLTAMLDVSDSNDYGDAADNAFYEVGNMFATREQAEVTAEAVKALLEGVHGGNQHFFDDTVRKAYDAAYQAVQGSEKLHKWTKQ